MTSNCIGCGREIPAERTELGYTYCTAPACQAQYRQGPTVTAVAVNKSGDAYRVAEPEDIAARAAAGEFATKNTGLGTVHQDTPRVPAPRRPTTRPTRPTRTARPATPAWTPAWTPAQENIVRLYADMGLSPRQIAARARENTPRLGITEALAVRILSSPRR
ncbi:hypothetical protein Acsp06_41160 [Actinomycetospora sp. NBRC 106375]|uniref:hypothetical protein n=1 Tax=Actinomycetospora sp. NBRC 106375 TaxID=3032207 RepID=UPI0024A2FC93|nr:hypothetical protein [Actinomycetospora sp. NBRC 106375]GLZ47931.1 hypothetical protein Acsp06_41160 [Actinomycetospora sp. NBRC 106375]